MKQIYQTLHEQNETFNKIKTHTHLKQLDKQNRNPRADTYNACTKNSIERFNSRLNKAEKKSENSKISHLKLSQLKQKKKTNKQTKE